MPTFAAENKTECQTPKNKATMSKKVFIRGEYAKSVTLEKNVKDIRFILSATKRHSLSDSETNELVEKAKKGDTKAQNALVEDNADLVLSIARSFQFVTYDTLISLSDLFNEGSMGIILAIPNYDSTKGNFSNLASAYIRREIVEFIQNNGRIVRRPCNKQDGETLRHTSLDEPISDEDGDTKGDMLTTDTLAVRTNLDSLSLDIARVLNGLLTERETDIVCRSFGFGQQAQANWEIADIYGMTEERVRQIVVGSIGKIKADTAAMAILRKYIG